MTEVLEELSVVGGRKLHFRREPQPGWLIAIRSWLIVEVNRVKFVVLTDVEALGRELRVVWSGQ